jgi:hypothetical protein
MYSLVRVSGLLDVNGFQTTAIHSRLLWLCVAVAAAGGAIPDLVIGKSQAVAQESLVAPEKNPPGDIPDDQVFIRYDAPEGFSLKVPEGWSRQALDHGVRFFDKYGVIEVTVGDAAAPPTAPSLTAEMAADLAKGGHSVKIGSIEDVRALASFPAALPA